ncbi:HOG (high osmolarity glycerol) pathway protein [Cadophora gregata]|uniref:HOG (high osmolarity glycerol) pathway protein n=1 Tax=Cadophora gregata TaxID=51156 RepID=UPI0026DCA3A7|nr:HOG (high osmolarity glycerol) pathway protein [Cadophora gregata]KAK0118131.1 HOG (high osmolarity glycerol) pathway protein [Cadophora gregata]KAK0123203.1 HOG (high osmolarity glycerol) pathway protein [Cadophora gregata f. sp. sojae]
MTAVMSPTLDTSSPATSPSPVTSPSSNPNHPPLPPLITSPPARRSNLQRPTSHASKNRLSQYSNYSVPSRSRPPSHIFPVFHSSLPYTTVRDFAYPVLHPMHYGPPLEPSQPPSGLSTPASETHRRLSDPPTSWDSRGSWVPGSWATEGLMKGEQLAPIHFGDGPPWSEDEDLQSPVVVSSRHRKHKSSTGGFGSSQGRGRGRNRREDGERTTSMLSQENYEQDRGFFVGRGGDGSERYYVNEGDEADGPGGEFVTYPPEQARHSNLAPYNVPGQRDSHFAGTLPSRSYTDETGLEYRSESDASSSASSPGLTRHDESRYSRDYQFTIASPDEEMHGKAVALFDFERENENELPLVEGQVIWVSYRHGQGWLVAEDPKTQESGLVPEEYVRLLRDIQGGLNSLTGQATDQLLSPVAPDSGTPTQAEHGQGFGHTPTPSNGSNGYQQPIVSTFSTSSKDLHPYPQHLLGTPAGQPPPQVIHYHGQRGGSQANTPTLSSSQEGARDGTTSQDTKSRKTEDSLNTTPIATLPGTRLETASKQPGSPDSDSTEGSSDAGKDISSP